MDKILKFTRQELLFASLLIYSVRSCIVANRYIQAPRNMDPLVESLLLLRAPEAIVENTCIRQEQQKQHPDCPNLEVQINTDAEKC